jgi:hypothetical protein
VGHVAMTLDDGTYISSWPASNSPSAIGSYPIRTPDLAQDNKDEQTIALNLHINGLDEAAIKKWWQNYLKNKTWQALTRNCGEAVITGLRVGGLDAKYPIPPTTKNAWDNINDAVRERDMPPVKSSSDPIYYYYGT